MPTHLIHINLLLLALIPQILERHQRLEMVFVLVVFYVFPVLLLDVFVGLAVLELGFGLAKDVGVRFLLVEYLFCI
jgi:hypothetical protein